MGNKMVDIIRKRDGSLVPFHSEKITRAIFKAAKACGGNDYSKAECLGNQVTDIVTKRYNSTVPTVEDVQDIVEKVLIENGHAQTAKAYILYREKRKGSRELNALVGATIEMFSNYLDDKDWQIKENANTQKSINGLNNYVREVFTKQYWLNEVYPLDIKKAHETGDLHLHDLGFFGAYCAGWDLRQLLMNGFGGIAGKIKSHPAKHLRAFLGQVVNSTFTTQGECYSDDTEVLTNNGWKLFKDIDKEKDLVCTRNINNQVIEFQKPIEYFEYNYDGKMYNFKNKEIDLLVTPGHKMIINDFRGMGHDGDLLVTASTLLGKTFKIPRGGLQSKNVEQYSEYFKGSGENITVEPSNQAVLDYTGKVYCVEVPNHTLFVRRNGRATWCGNCAGAQAWSSFDTYCAPFLRKDDMT